MGVSMMKTWLAALALVLLAASPAFSVGPLIGTNCTDSWGPPSTWADGTPITGTITYNVWIVQNVQTAPGRAPDFANVSALTVANICAARAGGQWTFGVSAIAGGLESTAIMFPFVLVIPNSPTGITIGPGGVATWTLPTINTDSTAIAGTISTEIWWMPSTATAPAGPPNLTVTGTTATLTPPAGRYAVFFKALTALPG